MVMICYYRIFVKTIYTPTVMNALFLAQEAICEGNGISKKILSQCKGLADNGIDVSLCHLKSINGAALYFVDDEVLFSLGKGHQASARY